MVPLAGKWMEEYTPCERNDKFIYIKVISILLKHSECDAHPINQSEET
jgi:hypothetical protein